MRRIPTHVSVAFIRIRAGRTDIVAADRGWPFTEDIPVAGSPADFRWTSTPTSTGVFLQKYVDLRHRQLLTVSFP